MSFPVEAETEEHDRDCRIVIGKGKEIEDYPPYDGSPYNGSAFYPACKFVLYEALGERPRGVGIRREDLHSFRDYLSELQQLPEIFDRGKDFLPIDFK